MRTLHPEEYLQVQGGANGINFTLMVNVATDQYPALVNLLSQTFMGNMNATELASLITADPADYNAMTVTGINIKFL